jgi:hypothetical protein
LVDKNNVNMEMERLSVKYITSKGVFMLPIQQTTMYSNLVTDGREVDGVTHMRGQVVYCKQDQSGLTIVLIVQWWLYCVIGKAERLSFLVKSFVNVWGLGIVDTQYSGVHFHVYFGGCGVPMCSTSSKINNVCISLAAVSHQHFNRLTLLSLKP